MQFAGGFQGSLLPEAGKMQDAERTGGAGTNKRDNF
jgi:hypothetical protein